RAGGAENAGQAVSLTYKLHPPARFADHEERDPDQDDDDNPLDDPVAGPGLLHRYAALRQEREPRWTRLRQSRRERLHRRRAPNPRPPSANQCPTPRRARPDRTGMRLLLNDCSTEFIEPLPPAPPAGYRNSPIGERSSRNVPLGTDTVCQLS